MDNTHAEEFIGIIRNRVNIPNRLADYVEARNLNRHRIEFKNISGHLPHLPHFPVLNEDEMILFSVGTYQLKLAASTVTIANISAVATISYKYTQIMMIFPI